MMAYLSLLVLFLQSQLTSPGEIRSVTLERTGGYHGCPQYTVQVFSDGKVNYDYEADNGEGCMKVSGRCIYDVNPDSAKSLFGFVVKMNFFALDSQYTVETETDAMTQYITVQTNSGSKTIEEYGLDGPEQLRTLVGMIERIAGTAEWRKYY